MIVRSRNSKKRLATFACVAAALTLLFGLGRAMANDDTIAVSIDQAKLVKLPMSPCNPAAWSW